MAYRFEGVRKVLNARLLLFRRPTEGEHIEARRLAEKSILLEKRQRQLRQSPLLLRTHGSSGASRLCLLGGANFHEDDTSAVHSDQIEFSKCTLPIPSDNTVA